MDKSKTNFITAVIITKNEAQNISTCLQSLQGIADEIVIADSYSSDNTKVLSESFPGVKFLEKEWEGYARTKNWANSMASYDWILSIDADEALSPALQQTILNLKPTSHQYFYSFNRLTNYCGQWVHHGGWYPDTKLRMFDRRQARWAGDFVHETLEMDPGIKPIILKGDLYHYSFSTVGQHMDKVNHYSTLGAKDKYSRGKKSSLAKMLYSPLSTFISMYFFKLGILDGRRGLIIAAISAHFRFLRYAKLYLLWQDDKKAKG